MFSSSQCSRMCFILQALATRIIFKHNFHVPLRHRLLFLDFIFCIGTVTTPDYTLERWVENTLLLWAHFFRIWEEGPSPNTTSTFLSDIDKHRAGVLLLQICFEILPKTILKSFNIWKTSISILILCLNGASLFSYRERGITYSDKGRWIGRHCAMCAFPTWRHLTAVSTAHCSFYSAGSRSAISHLAHGVHQLNCLLYQSLL